MERTEHMLAHPYYLYGVQDERDRLIALIKGDNEGQKRTENGTVLTQGETK